MERLPIPIKNVLREPFDESGAEMVLGRRQKPRRMVRGMIAAPIALAAAALLGWAVHAAWSSSSESTVAPAPAALALPDRSTGPARIATSDGSHIDLEDGAELQTIESGAREVVLLARGGVLRFDITPHGPRRWTIECELATVVVLGTRFRIETSQDRLRVSVERGAVLVRGERVPERARRLAAGEEIVIEAPVSVIEPTPAMPEPTPLAPTRRASRWRELASRQEWDEAYDELGGDGIRSESRRASVEELFMLADVARISGHPADAVAPLERIVHDHRGDPQAGLAAFTLGRLEADLLHRPDRAERAFEDAISLGLPAGLEADARARLERARER